MFALAFQLMHIFPNEKSKSAMSKLYSLNEFYYAGKKQIFKVICKVNFCVDIIFIPLKTFNKSSWKSMKSLTFSCADWAFFITQSFPSHFFLLQKAFPEVLWQIFTSFLPLTSRNSLFGLKLTFPKVWDYINEMFPYVSKKFSLETLRRDNASVNFENSAFGVNCEMK